MLPAGNGPGPNNSMYHPNLQPQINMQNYPYMITPNIQGYPNMQPTTNIQGQPINNSLLMYQNQANQQYTNISTPQIYSTQPVNPAIRMDSNVSYPCAGEAHASNTYSDNDLIMSSDNESMQEDNPEENRHPWQVVTKKRKIHKAVKETSKACNQITTSNKFQLLEQSENQSQRTNNPENDQNKITKPPPIYIYGVTNFKAMIENLAQAVEDETYHTKTVSANTVKINTHTVDTYRKLIRHLDDEKIIHHTYQLKEERAYRVVIRGLHHSMPTEEVIQELQKKGHKVRNIINIKHRVSKIPLPLFFVDLEPQDNNKDIYDIEFLAHTKITIEPPRKKREIIQCTRCQSYGHSKSYCRKPFNCVKCGKAHDSKTCEKPKNTPATCALCQGSHPANYKGCTVYRDLLNLKNPQKAIPQQNINKETYQQNNSRTSYIQPNARPSYAQITHARPENPNTNSTNIEDTMTRFLTEFKEMFNQLLNQNSMILNMLTMVINKITK